MSKPKYINQIQAALDAPQHSDRAEAHLAAFLAELVAREHRRATLLASQDQFDILKARLERRVSDSQIVFN